MQSRVPASPRDAADVLASIHCGAPEALVGPRLIDAAEWSVLPTTSARARDLNTEGHHHTNDAVNDIEEQMQAGKKLVGEYEMVCFGPTESISQ